MWIERDERRDTKVEGQLIFFKSSSNFDNYSDFFRLKIFHLVHDCEREVK